MNCNLPRDDVVLLIYHFGILSHQGDRNIVVLEEYNIQNSLQVISSLILPEKEAYQILYILSYYRMQSL